MWEESGGMRTHQCALLIRLNRCAGQKSPIWTLGFSAFPASLSLFPLSMAPSHLHTPGLVLPKKMRPREGVPALATQPIKWSHPESLLSLGQRGCFL